jgi:hypothetical protein
MIPSIHIMQIRNEKTSIIHNDILQKSNFFEQYQNMNINISMIHSLILLLIIGLNFVLIWSLIILIYVFIYGDSEFIFPAELI